MPTINEVMERVDRVKPVSNMDGARPADSVTRQELAVVLDRLGLLD